MKILHVLENSLPNLAGYTIRSKYIVENQKKHGMNPIVITSPFFKSENYTVKCEEINGIRYYRTNFIKRPLPEGNKLLSYLTRFRMIQKYKKAVFEIAKKEKPDIIHAHSSYTNGHAANHVSKLIGIPSIYELRSLWGESAVVEDELSPNSFKYKAVWGLELKAMKQADRVIAISQGIKNEIVKRGIIPSNVDIVPNGVDSNLFVPIKKDYDKIKKYDLNGSFVLGYIGSIRKLEGLSYLIDAFARIEEKRRNIKLIIVGDGPEKKNIEQHADRLGLTGIKFVKNVAHQDILQYYSIIDLFVFPRINAKINQAVTPLKPLEAMACGKVCLCSDVEGLTELIKNDYNGVVIRSEDFKDLAEKVISISSDKQKYDRLRNNALHWVKKQRDWSVLIPKYYSIYKDLIDLSS